MRRITAFGETLNVREWAKKLNIKYGTLSSRFKRGGQSSVEDILSAPVRGGVYAHERNPIYNNNAYACWETMKSRCMNPNSPDFKYYGARGIVVCERWRRSFPDFLEDMGNRPSPTHTLDRIDTNGNYEPGNVRWATTAEQADNKRTSLVVEYRGKRLTIGQAMREAQSVMPRASITGRLRRGWPVDEALESGPLRHGRERRTT